MLLANPELIAFEMLLFQNSSDLLLPPTALDLEYLNEAPLETPQSAQGVTPAPSPPHVPDTPPVPPPQTAALPPPIWHKIPQKVYDHGRKQWDYTPSDCISFGVNGYPGMNMRDALRKRFTDLVGRDDLVLRDAGSVISCRLSVRLLQPLLPWIGVYAVSSSPDTHPTIQSR